MALCQTNATHAAQAELDAAKREAARPSPEPKKGGPAAAAAAKGRAAREGALCAELEVTRQALAAAQADNRELSSGLEKASALIEVRVSQALPHIVSESGFVTTPMLDSTSGRTTLSLARVML